MWINKKIYNCTIIVYSFMKKKILHLNTETVQLKFVQNLGLSNSNAASELTSYKHLRISTQQKTIA